MAHRQTISRTKEYIKLKNRFKNAPENKGSLNKSLLSTDCTNCQINEPHPWDPKWMSVKFHGPGLKCVVTLALYSDNICYSDGPFVLTKHEGVALKEGLLTLIPKDEPIETDAGPCGDNRIMGPNIGLSTEVRKQKLVARARQETSFNRLKQFNVLDTHFHHTNADNNVIHDV